MKPLVTDGLWAGVAPLLPRRRAQPKGGRPWMDDRATLNGVLYVLRTGLAWRHLPTELGWGSGVTCWRRLREWQRRRRVADAAPRDARPARGGGSDRLDAGGPRQQEPSREKGGAATGRNPTDKGKAGSKHHVLTGPPRHPARGRGGRGERARQPHAGTAARRGGAGAHRAAWARAAPAAQAARGQGLRLPPVPGRMRRPGAFSTGSPARASRARTDSAGIAGSWSARWRGSRATGG